MNEATTIQERYATATQSSSLRVQADVRGDADYLIAAGWCRSRFGIALMRLQSEWDGAERWGVRSPRKPTKREIMAEAQVTFTTVDKAGKKAVIRKITTQSMEAARLRLEKRFENEMHKVVLALKTLPAAGLHLSIKMAFDGDAGEDLPARVLLHWLSSTCSACQGRKFQLIPGKDVLSERACGCCKGAGVVPPPGGKAGAEALGYIDDCINFAREQVRKPCRS